MYQALLTHAPFNELLLWVQDVTRLIRRAVCFVVMNEDGWCMSLPCLKGGQPWHWLTLQLFIRHFLL